MQHYFWESVGVCGEEDGVWLAGGGGWVSGVFGCNRRVLGVYFTAPDHSLHSTLPAPDPPARASKLHFHTMFRHLN